MSELRLQDLITDFVEYCEIEKGLSPNTAEKYDYRLSRFLAWAKDYLDGDPKRAKLALKDLTEELVRKFRIYLNRQGLASSTQYHYAVTLRAFLKYLVKRDLSAVEPERVELGKYDRAQSIKFLDPEQLEALLDGPDTSTVIGLRDRAMLEVLFSTGLRVSELVNLDVDDINLGQQEFNVVGKGGQRRVVFLSSSAKEWLEKYLEHRQEAWEPLFISYSGPRRSKGSRSDENFRDGSEAMDRSAVTKTSKMDEVVDDPRGNLRRITARSVLRMIKKYVRKAGLSVDATPHTLRHSFATDLLRGGADLRVVQESLGHKNISTTQIYTHITNIQLKKAHRKFHGRWRRES